MTSIIRAHLNWDGTFANKNDKRYQLINWTDEYKLYGTAVFKDGKNIRAEYKGSLEEMTKLYEKYKDKTVYLVIVQVRILGDGSKDVCAVRGKTCGNFAPKGFKFEEVVA